MIQRPAMEFGDYLAIFRRRKIPFFSLFGFILLVGLTITFTLPSVYRSEATILIERQEIPVNLIATTVTGYVQERIEGTKQRLITYESLVEIAKKLDLFPEMRKNKQTSEMVSLIRQNIDVAMIDVKASVPGKGGQSTATVAFIVGYEAESPEVAQLVAKELSQRYLEANKQARSEQTAEVSLFLEQETERLRNDIVTLEAKLAIFKQEKSDQLPELFQVNMRLYEKTEGQIESSNDRILKIQDQIISLESELSLTDPRKSVRAGDGNVIQSPAEKLSSLASQYLQSSVIYSPSHPDMIRMRREIKALGSQSNEAAEVSKFVAELTKLRSELIDARQKYSDEHPDVLKLEKEIAVVENELRGINLVVNKSTEFSNVPADNPRYVSLKTRMDNAISNVKEEKAKLKKYQKKLLEYEERLFQTPIVERDFQTLTRDYGNAKQKYQELINKQMEARLAESLEAGNKGERFVLEGRAYLPSSPDKPNRLGIALLTGLIAFLGGVIALAIFEFSDKSIQGGRSVVEIFGAPPIVVIPYIENLADKSKQRRRQIIFVLLVIASFALSYWVVDSYFYAFAADQ